MQLSPEVLKGLQRKRAMSGVPKPPMQQGPTAGGMQGPQKPGGDIQRASSMARTAQTLLLQAAVLAGGSSNDVGDACMKAANALAKAIGQHEGDLKDLDSSEKKVLTAGAQPGGAPGGGAAPPGAPQMPGAPPGGAPPMPKAA